MNRCLLILYSVSLFYAIMMHRVCSVVCNLCASPYSDGSTRVSFAFITNRNLIKLYPVATDNPIVHVRPSIAHVRPSVAHVHPSIAHVCPSIAHVCPSIVHVCLSIVYVTLRIHLVWYIKQAHGCNLKASI